MKRLKDNCDVPEARLGTLPKTFTSSKGETKLHSARPRKNGYFRLRQQREPGETEFVVDSGAGMHMVSKRDFNSAELETVKISKNPTTVMTANGEVQTREEATVYVKELDSFVTMMLVEETPALLSLGKLCEDHGYNYHWTSGQKPQLNKKNNEIDCKFFKLCAIRCPWFTDKFLHIIHTYFFNIFIAGSDVFIAGLCI